MGSNSGGGGVGDNASWVSIFFWLWVVFDFGLLMVVDLHGRR